MELAKEERDLVTAKTAPRYRRSKRHGKTRILDEYVALTGYDRSYARWLLRTWGHARVLQVGGVAHRYVVGRGRQRAASSRPRRYDAAVVAVLQEVWLFSGELCGKSRCIGSGGGV
jgi:hypothetical protein